MPAHSVFHASMLPILEQLLFLQESDLSIRKLTAEKEAIPATRTALERRLTALGGAYDKAVQGAKETEVKRSMLEKEVRARREQIQKYEAQRSQTRKNDEYQAIGAAIETTRADITRIEDQQLDIMEALEAMQPHIDAAKKELDESKSVITREIADLDQKLVNLAERIVAETAERDRRSVGIDEGVLDTYRRLLHTRDIAVVPLQDQYCGGCDIKVVPDVAVRTRTSEEPVQCNKCSRFLYPVR
jgi:predicted  nucleic acid-binding Zn-ribbon protein